MEETDVINCLLSSDNDCVKKIKAIQELRQRTLLSVSNLSDPYRILAALSESLQAARDFGFQREAIAALGSLLGSVEVVVLPEQNRESHVPVMKKAFAALLGSCHRKKLIPLVQATLLSLAKRPCLPTLAHALVHMGLEHDDKMVRLASVEILPVVLCEESKNVQGVDFLPSFISFQSVLEGLVGRIRDIDDDVAAGALDALSILSSAHHQLLQATIPKLGPLHQHLLQSYKDHIFQETVTEEADAVREKGFSANPSHHAILEPVAEQEDEGEVSMSNSWEGSAGTPFITPAEMSELLRQSSKRASMGNAKEAPPLSARKNPPPPPMKNASQKDGTHARKDAEPALTIRVPTDESNAGQGKSRSSELENESPRQAHLLKVLRKRLECHRFDSSTFFGLLQTVIPILLNLADDVDLKVSSEALKLAGEVIRQAGGSSDGCAELRPFLGDITTTLANKLCDAQPAITALSKQVMERVVEAAGLRRLKVHLGRVLGHPVWQAQEGILAVLSFGLLLDSQEALGENDLVELVDLALPLIKGRSHEKVMTAALDTLAAIQQAWLRLPSAPLHFSLYQKLQEMKMVSDKDEWSLALRCRLASGRMQDWEGGTGMGRRSSANSQMESRSASSSSMGFSIPPIQQCLSPVGAKLTRPSSIQEGCRDPYAFTSNRPQAAESFNSRQPNVPDAQKASAISVKKQHNSSFKLKSGQSGLNLSTSSLKSVSEDEASDPDGESVSTYHSSLSGSSLVHEEMKGRFTKDISSPKLQLQIRPAVREGGFTNASKSAQVPQKCENDSDDNCIIPSPHDAIREYVPSWQTPRSQAAEDNFLLSASYLNAKNAVKHEDKLRSKDNIDQCMTANSTNEDRMLSAENAIARMNMTQLDPSKLRTLKKRTISRKAQRRALSADQAESNVRYQASASTVGEKGAQNAVTSGPLTPMPVGVYENDGTTRAHMETTDKIRAPLALDEAACHGVVRDDSSDNGSAYNGDKEKGTMYNSDAAEDSVSANRAKRPVPLHAARRRRVQPKDNNPGFEGDNPAGRHVGERNSLTLDPPAGSQVTSLKAENFDYLTSEDIRPSPNPHQELQKTLNNLPNDEWPETYHTLNSVRRLALHHAALLEPHLHAIVRALLKQSENLRSAVKKNAILALEDVWRGLGKTCDPELDMVAPALIKRVAESNGFLVESAEKAIYTIVENATPRKALEAFIVSSRSRNAQIRAKTATVILKVLHQMGRSINPNSRELLRVLSELPLFLQDANVETRQAGKHIVFFLLSEKIANEELLKKHIPEHILQKTLQAKAMMGQHFAPPDFLEAREVHGKGALPAISNKPPSRSSSSVSRPNVCENVAGVPNSKPNTRQKGYTSDELSEIEVDNMALPRQGSARSERGGIARRGRGGRTVSGAGPPGQRPSPSFAPSAAVRNIVELEELPDLYRRMMNSDWRERLKATETVIGIVKKHATVLYESGKIVKIFDRIIERLQDGNLKVQLFLLEEMKALISDLGNKLEPCLNTLVPALALNLAASNSKVSSGCQSAMAALCDTVDDRFLCEWFTGLAISGTPKVRVWMMAKLGDLAPSLNAKKPALLRKHVLPLVWQSLTENKPDIRIAAVQLLRKLDDVLPDIKEQMGSLSEEQRATAENILHRRR